MNSVEPQDWIVSVDDHVIEPPHTWQSRLPARLRDRGPRVITDEAGEAWMYDGKRIPVPGLVVQAGIPKEKVSPLAVRFAEMPVSAYEPQARAAVMDEEGVLASLCYPHLPRFCGQEFMEGSDQQLGLLCVEAYNDFILDEWCGSAPGRFIPVIIIPLWDPILAVREIHRCAERGARVVSFSEEPSHLGLPSIHDPGRYWDPVFAAVTETRMSLGIHIGSSSRLAEASPNAPWMVQSCLMGWRSATTFAEWIFSDVFVRFPDLRITLSEGGIGWLPMALERADYALWKNRHYADRYGFRGDLTIIDYGPDRTVWPYGDLSPSDVFRAHIRGCFIPTQDRALAADLIRQVGPAYIMLETDYPHTDSSLGETQRLLAEQLLGLNPQDRRRIRRENAFEWYEFDSALSQA